jgi:hypothetical protein
MKAKRSKASACECGREGSFFMGAVLARRKVPQKKTLVWDHVPAEVAGRPPRNKPLGASRYGGRKQA